LGLNIYVGSKLAQLTHNWLKVGSYKRYLQAHLKATQADAPTKAFKRACKNKYTDGKAFYRDSFIRLDN
jgi:hypothetical protein